MGVPAGPPKSTLYNAKGEGKDLKPGCQEVATFEPTSALTTANSVLLFRALQCVPPPEPAVHGIVLPSETTADLGAWKGQVKSVRRMG